MSCLSVNSFPRKIERINRATRHVLLHNRLFRRRSRKLLKLLITDLNEGETGGFPLKGPVTRKCFHLMTSSWRQMCVCVSNVNLTEALGRCIHRTGSIRFKEVLMISFLGAKPGHLTTKWSTGLSRRSYFRPVAPTIVWAKVWNNLKN